MASKSNNDKVSDDLRSHMMGLIEAFQAKKSKNNKVKEDIGSSKTYDVFTDPNLEAHMPSFEKFSSIPSGIGDKHVSASKPTSSNLKRACTRIDSLFIPHLNPGAQPPLMPNGRR